MNFKEVILELKKRRPIFHSEDDLKLEMALVIKELYPNNSVRLECPVNIIMKLRNDVGEHRIARSPIDIVVMDNENKTAYPIEIKYKTKKVEITLHDEEYRLTNHGANDIGRYSFRKDLYRIENIDLVGFKVERGFVFILTNDKGYYNNDVSGKNSLDSYFSFHHGVKLSKEYNGWNYQKIDRAKYDVEYETSSNTDLKKHWTIGNEFIYNLKLANEYIINWEDYSNVENRTFKYCLIEVNRL